jgi:hypothetical protein
MISYHRLLALALFVGTSTLVLTAVLSACREAAEQRRHAQSWSSGAQAGRGAPAPATNKLDPDRLASPPARVISSNCPAGQADDPHPTSTSPTP